MISIADVRRGALDAIDRFVNTEPTPEAVLRRSVDVLAERFDYPAVAVRRPGAADIVAGAAASPSAETYPIVFSGEEVGRLVVDGAGEHDRAFLEHVARMLSSRCGR
jgi:hypothetical protein